MLRVDPRALAVRAALAEDAVQGDAAAGGAAPAGELAYLRAALAESQAALRESRRQFGHLVGNLNGVAYQCPLEPPWRMAFVSKGVEELTGYRAETLEQVLAWAEIMHPDDLPAVEAEVAAAVAERRRFALCYRIRHRSGELRWVREQGQAVCGPGGEPLFLEGVIADAGAEKRLELSLRAAEAEAQGRAASVDVLLDAVPQMLWSHGADGSLYYSRQFKAFTGAPLGEPGAPSRIEFVHPDDRAEAVARWEASLAGGEPYEAQYRLRHHQRGYRWVLSRANPHRREDGAILGWYGTCTDIHEAIVARLALDESERLNRGLIEAMPDCVSVLDLEGRRLFANAATMRAYGIADCAELVGELWGVRFPDPVRVRAEAALAAARSGEVARLQIQYGGAERWWDIVLAPVDGEDGTPNRIIVISRDVSDHKEAEEKASWAADHDPLTGLPNRLLFQRRLDEAIRKAEAEGSSLGILLLDVDDFKRVNDTLGHDAGDALLCTFAERMRAALREEDMIARLGGDEFAILLCGAGAEDEVGAAVESILAALREPCVHGGRVLDCQASLGASLFPLQGRDRAELLKNADVALYAAKAAGRANLKLFRPEMRLEMQQRISMLNLARDAIAGDCIQPFYQPKLDLRSGTVAGFEALLRWNHPTRGPQSPATIAAAFEDLSLAAEISDRMIDRVLADMRRWHDHGVRFGHVAINAAAAEFRRGDFADKLLERLGRASLPPHLLQVEVTETVFLGRGADCVERALRLLSQSGVCIALDDFGTGYASLSHLKQFPVDFIKIDRSFVRDLEEDPDDAAIVDAVVKLGRSLGIGIVAEGVETERQHDFLLSLGCEFGQGYLYGRAAPAAKVAALWGESLRPHRFRLAS